MRQIAVVVLVFLAGCSEPTPDAADGPRTTETSQADVPAGAIVELAGSNVTWVGTGFVEWDLTVPEGLESLEFSWYHLGDFNGALVGVLTMDGCEDDPTTSTGGSAAHRWCADPPPGAHHATYRLLAGHLSGRLCIMGIPEGNNTLGDCLGSPYAG